MASFRDSFMVPRHAPNAEDLSFFSDASTSLLAAAAAGMDLRISAPPYNYPRTATQNPTLGSPMAYVDPSLYTETNYMFQNRPSPGMVSDEPDLRGSASNLSSASSAPSSASSIASSPPSNPSHTAFAEWSLQGLAIAPGIVGQNDFMHAADFSYCGGGGGHVEDSFDYGQGLMKDPGFVDPSMIDASELRRSMMQFEASLQQQQQQQQQQQHHLQAYPVSPALSSSSHPSVSMQQGDRSPFLQTFQAATAAVSPFSPFQAPVTTPAHKATSSNFVNATLRLETWSPDESNDKSRCTCTKCGKVFKDIKAHMLTHLNERPEKCPITSCDYHTKGFARRYDKNRHTLTHYKGNMVCGFCPGSGSAAEKSFNRADVFKRHLTSVHGVEQAPPNSRKKAAAAAAAAAVVTGDPAAIAISAKHIPAMSYSSEATGKCSTCSQMFASAQELYEHIDECVLRIVQQEDPAEVIDARRLAEVENDDVVTQTLERNRLPLTTAAAAAATMMTTTQINIQMDAEDEDMENEDDGDDETRVGGARPPQATLQPPKKVRPVSGVRKRGMTQSRGGVDIGIKKGGRKSRREYPSSWGFDKSQMTLKKRVTAVFDGTRRLVKDDMILPMENEVRVALADGKSYVTDLDILSLQRAEAYLDASAEEKATWMSDDPTPEEVQRMTAIVEGKLAKAEAA